jgi:hypothetical protein
MAPAVVDVLVDPAPAWPCGNNCCGGEADADADDCFCAAPSLGAPASISISAVVKRGVRVSSKREKRDYCKGET